MDFDDLILWSLQMLRDQPRVRERWQGQWEFLLVDEYQDIEPAQELLVRILAAPHDQLFCVGDEDQTLYAFRRASVGRIICLDEHYPALRRIALGVNYRCPGRIVAASDRLIAVNQVRFPKRIAAAVGREHDGTITLREVVRQIDAAARVAQTLAAGRRGAIVVRGRLTRCVRLRSPAPTRACRSTARRSCSGRLVPDWRCSSTCNLRWRPVAPTPSW
jgi:DNA helicase-2/ATP-dependent DNA helicase PcrA